MNNKITKKALAIVLMLTMVLSTAAVSVATVSAASEEITYNLAFYTAAGQGRSSDEIIITIHGTNGSTGRHNVGKVGSSSTDKASFKDVNVGTITGVTVQNKFGFHISVAQDGWYPFYIAVNNTKIYGGRWVDNEVPVTMNVTDDVYKIIVNTGTASGAGTDSPVEVTLYSTNGKTSQTVDVSSIHPGVNAFENGDTVTFYMFAGNNFDKVKSVKFRLPGSGVYATAISWQLQSFRGDKVQGSNVGEVFSMFPYAWIAGSEPREKTFNF